LKIFLNKKEFAEEVGISSATLNRRLKDGTVHSTKLGARVLIPSSELTRLARMSSPVQIMADGNGCED